MSCLIEIETQDQALGPELLEKVKDLPANIILKKVAQAEAVKGYLTFFLSLGIKVDAGLVANWLFENIKDRATKLRMDRIEVQINQEETFLLQRYGDHYRGYMTQVGRYI